jgi:hypothetical protein
MVLYSFGCGEVEVRLTGLLLSRSALKEYKVWSSRQVAKAGMDSSRIFRVI